MKIHKGAVDILNLNKPKAEPRLPNIEIPEHRMTATEKMVKTVSDSVEQRTVDKKEEKPNKDEIRKAKLANGWIKVKLIRGSRQWIYLTGDEWDKKSPHEKMKYVIDAAPVPGNLKAKVIRGRRRTKVFSSLN